MRLLTLLLAWKGIEAADELFKVCQSASSDQVFDRALKRYVQLVSNPAFTRESFVELAGRVMEIARTSEQKGSYFTSDPTGGYLLGIDVCVGILGFKRCGCSFCGCLCGLEYRS